MMEAREHPELFRDDMVRRLRDGTKVQTRRRITARTCMRDGWPTSQKHLDELYFDSEKCRVDGGPSPAGNQGPYLHVPHGDGDTVHRVYPRVQAGDRLWVREAWSTDCLSVYPCPPCWYRADLWPDDPREDIEDDGTCKWHRPAVEFDEDGRMTRRSPTRHGDCFGCAAECGDGFRWRPSIHMPRQHCRIVLKVDAVRIERLQTVTPRDAWDEGARCACSKPVPACSGNRDAFAQLWDSMYGGTPYSWRSNRHVLVYEFSRLI